MASWIEFGKVPGTSSAAAHILGVVLQHVPLLFSTYPLNLGYLQLGCQLSVIDFDKHLCLTRNQKIHILDAAPPVSFSVPTMVGMGVRGVVSPIQLIRRQIIIFEMPRLIFEFDNTLKQLLWSRAPHPLGFRPRIRTPRPAMVGAVLEAGATRVHLGTLNVSENYTAARKGLHVPTFRYVNAIMTTCCHGQVHPTCAHNISLSLLPISSSRIADNIGNAEHSGNIEGQTRG